MLPKRRIIKGIARKLVTFSFPRDAYIGGMKKIFALLIALLATPFAAHAGEDYGNVEFLNGWRLPDGSYQSAIAFNLNDGWKTYWRVPGPAGLMTTLNWTGSSNIADIRVDWPAPKVFESYGMYSFGFKHRLVLPVRITPQDKDKPVGIDLKMEFGVCSDICYPGNTRLSETLTPKSEVEGQEAIRAALANVATPAARGGVKSARCTLTPNGKGFNITADIRLKRPVQPDQLVVMEYDDPDIWIDIPALDISGRDIRASSRLDFYGSGMLSLDRSRLRITLLQGGRAVEILGCPAG